MALSIISVVKLSPPFSPGGEAVVNDTTSLCAYVRISGTLQGRVEVMPTLQGRAQVQPTLDGRVEI